MTSIARPLAWLLQHVLWKFGVVTGLACWPLQAGSLAVSHRSRQKYIVPASRRSGRRSR